MSGRSLERVRRRSALRCGLMRSVFKSGIGDESGGGASNIARISTGNYNLIVMTTERVARKSSGNRPPFTFSATVGSPAAASRHDERRASSYHPTTTTSSAAAAAPRRLLTRVQRTARAARLASSSAAAAIMVTSNSIAGAVRRISQAAAGMSPRILVRLVPPPACSQRKPHRNILAI